MAAKKKLRKNFNYGKYLEINYCNIIKKIIIICKTKNSQVFN